MTRTSEYPQVRRAGELRVSNLYSGVRQRVLGVIQVDTFTPHTRWSAGRRVLPGRSDGRQQADGVSIRLAVPGDRCGGRYRRGIPGLITSAGNTRNRHPTPLGHAGEDPGQGTSAVVFEAALALEGLVDRLDHRRTRPRLPLR